MNVITVYYEVFSNSLERIATWSTQNAAARRLITYSRKCDLISTILNELHWLHVADHINFKILQITFISLHDLSSLYTSNMVSRYTIISITISGGRRRGGEGKGKEGKGGSRIGEERREGRASPPFPQRAVTQSNSWYTDSVLSECSVISVSFRYVTDLFILAHFPIRIEYCVSSVYQLRLISSQDWGKALLHIVDHLEFMKKTKVSL